MSINKSMTQIRSEISNLVQLCLGDEGLAGEEVFEHDAPEDRLELREAGAGRGRRHQGDQARAETHQHGGQRRPEELRQILLNLPEFTMFHGHLYSRNRL